MACGARELAGHGNVGLGAVTVSVRPAANSPLDRWIERQPTAFEQASGRVRARALRELIGAAAGAEANLAVVSMDSPAAPLMRRIVARLGVEPGDHR
jgi:hypothetical protein